MLLVPHFCKQGKSFCSIIEFLDYTRESNHSKNSHFFYLGFFNFLRSYLLWGQLYLSIIGKSINILRIQSLRHFASARIDSQQKVKCNHNHSKTPEEKILESIQGPPDDTTSIAYCVNLVRKQDYENFLCTLLLPNKQARAAMFGIRAFNTEISLIRDQVTQKEMGMGRMFFWRDALNQLYKKVPPNEAVYVPKHPVVIQLSKIVREKSLSKKWFSSLVDSRERVMTDVPFADLPELEKYCDQSITSVLYLALELLGVKNVEIDHAASHLGKAIGLSNFIRSLPHNSQRRSVLVPQDLLIKHKVSQENFVRNTESERIQEIVYELASHAHTHYEKAKSLRKSVTQEAFPVFLNGLPSLAYLLRLQKLNFNPYDPKLHRRNNVLPMKLYYKKFMKSYY